ncbi:APC family permease [Wenzhouxiangella marina]|uniref:Amino acid transporter n=1 Tax=Wenzhouxiangella marina TaxID=1579979 RepID=A0A0K0XVY0_9GAMM|nr:APC family permease [Wenzhouxiangella marina]AKS41864.1 amino acid transporter [Wenzhouxiangella marina]MBB6086370.1 amino acid transporter [Wenzhouxiangella marina]
MHRSGSQVSFWSAVSMGIGAMVGAGIFALLGQAGAMAGSAVWISFLIGGVVALLSGYSIGRLGARYPSAGGVVEYLVQAFGVGRFSGTMSVMMYIGSLVAVSLVARTFGSYAHAMLPGNTPSWLTELFAVAIVLLFMMINLDGARAMARIENLVVLVKMLVLVGFAIIGLIFVDLGRLAPSTYPPESMIFYSVAVTFFAYEGFRIVSNAAEDMEAPERTLPRAIMTAIGLVMAVYVAIAIAVFGNLPPERVLEAQDFALAEAARPILGNLGFQIVAVAALFATASAINASLYSVTNVTYRLATLGELPRAFGKPIRHSREGLVVSSALIILLASFFDLSQIAAIGALSMLIIHLTVHLGHLRLLRETRAMPAMIVVAILANAATIGLGVYHLARSAPWLLLWIAMFFLTAFVTEVLLHRLAGREINTRCPES